MKCSPIESLHFPNQRALEEWGEFVKVALSELKESCESIEGRKEVEQEVLLLQNVLQSAL
jgi:hypothetical protein